MPRSLALLEVCIDNRKILLTLNNNGLNDSFSIFRHDGICFGTIDATGKLKTINPDSSGWVQGEK
jgi:hypothetical protein